VIRLETTRLPAHEELRRRLDEAPPEHADALLAKMAGDIEPELVNRIAVAVPEGLAQASSTKTEAPGLFALLQKFNSPDCRRGMAFATGLLESLGKRLVATES